MEELDPRVLFLRYAFPCARVLVDLRNTLTEREFELMRLAVETNVPLAESYLEDKFCHAFEGIMKVSSNVWNTKTIRDYFWNKHEEHLSCDLPPTIKRLCVLKRGTLTKQFGDAFRVEINNEDDRIIKVLYRDPKIGDKVMVHYGYAVEKVA